MSGPTAAVTPETSASTISVPSSETGKVSAPISETGKYRQGIAAAWASNDGVKHEFQMRFEASTAHVCTLWNVFRVSIPHDWGAINNNHLLALLATWVLDMVICVVVALVMMALLFAYAQIPWHDDLAFYFTFAIILPFPVLWNVAQYASFTIQTSGHQTLMGHVRSLRLFGPVLLFTVGLATGLCVVFHQMDIITDDNRVNMSVAIGVGPILIGLWCKTALKNQYIREKFMAPEALKGYSAVRRVAVVDNVSRKPELIISAYNQGGTLKSEFGEFSAAQTFAGFKAPATCYVWTVLFSVGLVAALGALKDEGAAGLWGLFGVALVALLAGDAMLGAAVSANTGTTIYSMKMMVAFAYIYNTIVNSQIRIILMNFEHNRTVGLWLHPIFLTSLRLFKTWTGTISADVAELRAKEKEVFALIEEVDKTSTLPKDLKSAISEYQGTSMGVKLLHMLKAYLLMNEAGTMVAVHEDMATTAEQQTKVRVLLQKYTMISTKAYRFMTTNLVKMLSANIAVMNAVSMACMLNKDSSSPFLGLGTCGEDGFLSELVFATIPFFLFDLVELVALVYKADLPMYSVFFQLDPFVVVAVVVVNFMNFVLLALAVQ